MIQLINSTSKDTDPGHLTEYNEYTRMWVLEEKTAQFFVAQYKFRSVQTFVVTFQYTGWLIRILKRE